VPSTPGRTLFAAVCLVATSVTGGPARAAQQSSAGVPTGTHRDASSPQATFRSRVNLVSISAVVRDKRGRVLSSLSDQDFEVLDDGQRRELVLFRSGTDAPAGVAILMDGSGSMVMSAARHHARAITLALLTQLTPSRDVAALLSFDTRLLTLEPFTDDFDRIRAALNDIEAFGSTSLYDAIAGSASFVAERIQSRRALIVLTDGSDNASIHTPDEVAWIASTIDVPVYVFDVAASDGGVHEPHGSPKRRWLAELARATGGELFVAGTPAGWTAAVARLCDELRHQYVLAFEPAPGSGVRRVQLKTRNKDLRVTARAWYRTPSE
jgi:Ca-activated chloride channel family protein